MGWAKTSLDGFFGNEGQMKSRWRVFVALCLLVVVLLWYEAIASLDEIVRLYEGK